MRVGHVIERELESLRRLVLVMLNCDHERVCEELDSLKGENLLTNLDLSILFHMDTFMLNRYLFFKEIFGLKTELDLGIGNKAF